MTGNKWLDFSGDPGIFELNFSHCRAGPFVRVKIAGSSA